MENSIVSQICYGIKFERDYKFPWSVDNGVGGVALEECLLNNWWTYSICGYKPPLTLSRLDKWINEKEMNPQITLEWYLWSEFLEGKIPENKVIKCFNHYASFRDIHPLPYKLINYTINYCSTYILAVSRTVVSIWGYPKRFDLEVTKKERLRLINFCQTHNLGLTTGKMGWWLSCHL